MVEATGSFPAARSERIVLCEPCDQTGGIFTERHEGVRGRRKAGLELHRSGPRPLDRAGPRERECSNVAGFEMLGISLNGRHRLVVRDEYIAVRDGRAGIHDEVFRHACNVPSL